MLVSRACPGSLSSPGNRCAGAAFLLRSSRIGSGRRAALGDKLRRDDPAMGGAGGVCFTRWEASAMDRFVSGFVGLCLLIGLVALAGVLNVMFLIAYL